MSRWRRAFWGLVIAYSLFHLGYSILRYSIFTGTTDGDFISAHQQATDWAKAGTYSAKTGVWHPPFYYWLLLHLDRIVGNRQRLAYFFYFLQFLLFPLAIRWIARSADRGTRPLAFLYLAAAALCVNFQPFLETLALHKVEGIEFTLVALALICYRRKWDLLCGVAVVLAANLKYLPGILIPYFLVKREWKVLLGMVLTEAALVLLLTAQYGAETIRFALLQHPLDLLFSHRHEGTLPEASVEMQTLTGAVNRLLARPDPRLGFMWYIETENYMPVSYPQAAQAISGGLRLLLSGVWLVFIRRRVPEADRERAWPRLLLELSFTLVMILVVSQLARVHYAILVLPAFVCVGLLMIQDPRRFGRLEKGLFLASYGLSAMIVPGGALNRLPPLPIWGQEYSNLYLWASLPVWGYLLLGLCVLLCARRLGAER